jgi:hypothetical protein
VPASSSSIPFPTTGVSAPGPSVSSQPIGDPQVSVLPNSPPCTTEPTPSPQQPRIPDIPAGTKPDFVIDGSKIPDGMLVHLLAEEMRRSSLGDMKDDLLRFLLMRLLTSGASQKLEAGLALSSVSNQLKWQQLGANLRPQLLLDGSNFPLWSSTLINTVSSVTSNPKYFDDDTSGRDCPTSNGVLAVIKFSVNPVLHSLLNGMTAYGAYHSLKGRFTNPSWSLLLSCWSDVAQAPDASDSISASYESLKRSWLDLEEQLGGWTTDKLLSLFSFQPQTLSPTDC